MRIADLLPARLRRGLNVLAFRATTAPARAKLRFRKLAPGGALAYLIGLALLERVRTTWRRLRRARPRLIWGPSPMLNIKYWSKAMQMRGYESTSVVLAPASITKRDDFDRYRDEFLGDGDWSELLRDYAMFAWALRRGDVFMRFFDGGILRNGPLQWWEYPLLRLAGKKLIASPYGGDIAVSSYLGDLEEILLRDYPDIPTASPLLKRRILYTLKWADVSVHTYLPGFQPTHNAVWLNMLAIDVDMWQDASKQSTSDGHNRDVVIVHAPNHRHIKGTHHLEEAVSELIGEGLKIDLQILERRSNEEVRAAVLASDIVADQFVFSYGLFAVEGMAAGKPVLGNLSRIPDEFRGNESLEACPIVDTRPEMLRDDLRRLLTNPALRRELGEAGREFVLRYHSYDPVGRAFEALVEYAWNGKPLPKWLAPR